MKIAYYLTGAALLMAAVGFGMTGHLQISAIISAIAAFVAWLGYRDSRTTDQAVEAAGRSRSCITPEKVKKHRRQHPGVGIMEAVEALREQSTHTFPTFIGLSSRK
ncbi:MAG: hypothetical protein Q4E11_00980 [Corynebacterium sp.]|uniref:hypothetical protein n=1 Tax=Corynebacterium sp. TaxID=1720 RepID=UPI0026DCE76C|nr:hypothetical protein [Corynebacterium sp.]MDO5029147.1 hypothetical protein [Corynebacterium sp.]